MEILTTEAFLVGFIAGAGAILALFGGLFLAAPVLKSWVMAKSANSGVPLGWLIGMHLRGTPAELIVMAHVMQQKRGVPHDLAMTETTYIAFRDDVKTAGDLVTIVDREAARARAEPGPAGQRVAER
jgi:uncharacterized protein YqfA (UPF0365 family)